MERSSRTPVSGSSFLAQRRYRFNPMRRGRTFSLCYDRQPPCTSMVTTSDGPVTHCTITVLDSERAASCDRPGAAGWCGIKRAAKPGLVLVRQVVLTAAGTAHPHRDRRPEGTISAPESRVSVPLSQGRSSARLGVVAKAGVEVVAHRVARQLGQGPQPCRVGEPQRGAM